MGSNVRSDKLEVAAREIHGKEKDKDEDHKGSISSSQILRHILLDKMSVLLVFIPLALVAAWLHWGDPLVFGFCFLSLIPLAKILGDATEHLAESMNQTIGGLLNATFGNAVEMIITINAITNGLLEIVKQSLLGSILSNLLLVLGMAFFVGGLTMSEQSFPEGAALINVTMLLVGIMAFSIPTVFAVNAKTEGEIVQISRVSAIFVAVGYLAYLFFQLYTHVDMFEDEKEAPDSAAEEEEEALVLGAAQGRSPGSKRRPSVLEGLPPAKGQRDDEGGHEDIEKAVLSVPWAMALLCGSTIIVAILSEFMVDAIDGLIEQVHIPRSFLGVILLPIVGNACEHASAIRMAYNNKVATAIAIAVGSSTQIALLVMPFSIIYAWFVGQPLDLDMHSSGLMVIFMAVLIVFSIVMDGRSNWLEGFMLVLAYCLVAVLFWFTDTTAEGGPAQAALAQAANSPEGVTV